MRTDKKRDFLSFADDKYLLEAARIENTEMLLGAEKRELKIKRKNLNKKYKKKSSFS